MAFNSILRNININDKTSKKAFIEALENAKRKKSKEVIMSKTVKHLGKPEIEKLFNDK